MRSPLLIALTFVFGLCPARADDVALRRELEHVYSAWRTAIASHDVAGWQQTTAVYRQAMTRNMIVSQRQPFPAAMFTLPLHAPDTGILRMVKLDLQGPTAHLIYFGKVDLGITEGGDIPDNLLILRFIKEKSFWKYDTARLINLANAPDVRAQLKNSGSSPFLNDSDLAPTGEMPTIPPLCRIPDHVAVLEIVSLGYATSAKVNAFSMPAVIDNIDQQLIIGGLNDGSNSLKLQIQPTKIADNAKRKLMISAKVLTGDESHPAVKVFTWEPGSATVPATMELNIDINRLVLRGI